MSNEDQEDKVFKALASSVRRSLLDALKDAPKTTGELVDLFPELSRFAVMQHLGVLTEADLVIPVKRGRVRWNHLNPLPIRDIQVRWIGPYSAAAVDTLHAMKTKLEKRPDTTPARSR